MIEATIPTDLNLLSTSICSKHRCNSSSSRNKSLWISSKFWKIIGRSFVSTKPSPSKSAELNAWRRSFKEKHASILRPSSPKKQRSFTKHLFFAQRFILKRKRSTLSWAVAGCVRHVTISRRRSNLKTVEYSNEKIVSSPDWKEDRTLFRWNWIFKRKQSASVMSHRLPIDVYGSSTMREGQQKDREETFISFFNKMNLDDQIQIYTGVWLSRLSNNVWRVVVAAEEGNRVSGVESIVGLCGIFWNNVGLFFDWRDLTAKISSSFSVSERSNSLLA